MMIFSFTKHSQYLPVIMLFFLLLGWTSNALSKAYKYQDERGQWHFTDRPPKQSLKAQEIRTNSIQKNGSNADLAAMLKNKFPSNRPEKTATLAVVEIKNAIGLGSGFFFTETGYIVTNRHVVKPTETVKWDKYKESLARKEEVFMSAKRELNQRSAYHDRAYNSLIAFEKAFKKRWDRASRQLLEAKYNIMVNNYEESTRQLNYLKSKYITAKTKFEKSKSELSRKGSESYWAQRYKIRIKDGTKLYAKYIGASKDHDLAFLKLEGYKTPFLTASSQNRNLQGSRVYAIGSPLGVSDSLTSGSVTHIRDAYIYTDTSVFPGNSGGPLIDKTGKVLGVITQKITQGKATLPGFGKAIPIDIVTREFNKFRKGK